MDNVNNWEIWWNLSKLYWTAGNENWRHPSNWHWIKKKFTELKHSLLYSQELTNCPYPEPLESCPNPPKLFLWSILVLSFHIHLTCSTWSLSWRLPTKHCMHLCSPHACHITCPSHFSWFDHPNTFQCTRVSIMKVMYILCKITALRFRCLTSSSQEQSVVQK